MLTTVASVCVGLALIGVECTLLSGRELEEKESRFLSRGINVAPSSGEIEPTATKVRSVLGCSVLCSQTNTCLAFTVCKQNQRKFPYVCEMFSKIPAMTELKTVPNCRYFEMANIPCLNGGQYNSTSAICECVAGYHGLRCENIMRDCSEGGYYQIRPTGEYTIKPRGAEKPFKVKCIMEPTVGGFTLLMYRTKYKTPVENFNRSWLEYKFGFGQTYDNYWLGNEYFHQITKQCTYVLAVSICPYDMHGKFPFFNAYYQQVAIAGEEKRYAISLSGYILNWHGKSTAGDSLTPEDDPQRNIDGKPFSTFDNDVSCGCASRFASGWWFAAKCTAGNVNGRIGTVGTEASMNWENNFNDQEIAAANMMIRPDPPDCDQS